LQRTWLRQGGKRREILRLDWVKITFGAKTPIPLNKPLGCQREHIEILQRACAISVIPIENFQYNYQEGVQS
jgi:hypothetical protein